jgi:hypothetical protein
MQISADFAITDKTFDLKFDKFRVAGLGSDNIAIRLHSAVPPRSELRLGQEVYRKAPWAIYHQANSWAYLGISPDDPEGDPRSLAIFSLDHRRGSIYRPQQYYEKGNLESLATFPSDQILLARLLADREGCYFHASGMIIDGQGFLFVGHSEAGKSTMLKMLRGHGEILCDDRIILRRWSKGFRIHGTWSHGELPDVSASDAPLKAIMFLDKADHNELLQISNKTQLLGQILSYIIKPLVTADWWQKTLTLVNHIANDVPAYQLRFDLSGEVIKLLKSI